MMRPLCFFALVLLGMSAAQADLNSNHLTQAAAYSAKFREAALLVWEDGHIIYERGSRTATPRVYSITKSLVAMGVFRDGRQGGMSLDHRVCGIFRGITVADLMNQISGLPTAAHEFYGKGLHDKQRVLRGLKKNGTRGTFVYGPSHWEVLGEEIRQHRGKSVEDWIRRFVPGATSSMLARWRRDDQGVIFFSTGARLNARELLPAGREAWGGIKKEKWSSEVRTLLSNGTEANRMYALGFWLNRQSTRSGAREVEVESVLGHPHPADFWRNKCLSLAAPPDLVAMIGTAGQRVYVVPSQDLIVIRLGGRRGFSDAEFLRRLFAQP